VYHIRMASPPGSTAGVLEILGASSGVLNVTVLPGSARYPDGDVVECDPDPDVADRVTLERATGRGWPRRRPRWPHR